MGSQKTVLVTEDSAGSNTISGVKIIGTESLNGRRYPIDVLERCQKLYEGALVNINHKLGAEGRDYTDRIGRVVNVRCESDGLYGDLVYNPHHKDAKSLEWWAENDQKAVGLSHMAQVRSKWTQEGIEEVTDIVKVDSVDLVANPATTKGLLESVASASVEEDFFDEVAKRLEARAVRKKAGEPIVERSEERGRGQVTHFPTFAKFKAALTAAGAVRFQSFDGGAIVDAYDKNGKLIGDWLYDSGTLFARTRGPNKPKKEQAMEKKTGNYATWKSWVKAAGATRIDGDKDIATALDKDGKGVGEWDGETGYLYAKASNKESDKSFGGTGSDREFTSWRVAVKKAGANVTIRGDKSGAKAVDQSGKVVGTWDGTSGVKESEMNSEDLAAILSNTELDDAGKIAAIQELIAGLSGGDEEDPSALPLGEAEDETKDDEEDKEKPATESVRGRKADSTIRRLMEEVETYRLRDKRERLVKEAREACKGLPAYAVTESFVGVLADSEKKNWKTLVEDRRKVIYRGEAPISAAAPGSNLTVDALVKALRS